MKNFVTVSFIVFFMMITIGSSSAAIMYDNGPSLWDGAMAIGHRVVADDFVLDQDATISGASVDLWVNSQTFDFNGMNWWIFDDDNGDPGNIIASGLSQNPSPTYVGIHSSGNTNLWKLYFDLGSDVSLQSNTTFWFAMGLSNPSDPIVWSDTTPSGYNDATSLGGTFDNWMHTSSTGRNVAFTLQGSPVPIPGAVWLLGSGLLGILGLRRKKG